LFAQEKIVAELLEAISLREAEGPKMSEDTDKRCKDLIDSALKKANVLSLDAAANQVRLQTDCSIFWTMPLILACVYVRADQREGFG
jgi:hypothetical protein